jgi:hypothetical protein
MVCCARMVEGGIAFARPAITRAIMQGQQTHVKYMQGKGGPAVNGMNGHPVISVDTIYPSDMPQSIDDGARYGSEKGAYALMSKQGSISVRGNAAAHEPVVDLSVPSQMHDYQTGLGLSAPRQGGDIFDTWCDSFLISLFKRMQLQSCCYMINSTSTQTSVICVPD